MVKKLFKTESIFIILIGIFIILLTFNLPADPDLGWHLKNGEYLINNNFQVPATDIYSWTMPNFPLIMHEWLTDIGMYFLYQNFGLISISIIYALITFLAFFIVTKSIEAPLSHQIIACLLGVIASLPIISARAQMITLLGLALTIYLVQKYKENTKYKKIYWLPIIFFVWANLHGGFSIGLFFIALITSIEIVKILIIKINQKYYKYKFHYTTLRFKEIGRMIVVGFLSFLTTMINPYYWRLYFEIYTTTIDSFAKSYINEWLPFSFDSPMAYRFIIYTVLISVLIILNYKKLDFSYLIVAMVFLIISTSSWRHMPFFVLITIPYLVYLVGNLTQDKLRIILQKKWLVLIFGFMIISYFFQKTLPYTRMVNSEEDVALAFGYPCQAVNFLKANPIEGRMFNEYNWGGYLIWQLPEHPVFIDGRMASWRLTREDGSKQEILKDFKIIRDLESDWQPLFDLYNFDFILLSHDAPLAIRLGKMGWELIYRDNIAVIYKKI